jgi:hypothetical protein
MPLSIRIRYSNGNPTEVPELSEAAMFGAANAKGERSNVDAVTTIPQTDAKISLLIVKVEATRKDTASQIATSPAKFNG